MKSVRSKLFIYYAISTFISLFLLSFIGMYFFSKNYETKTLFQLENTISSVEKKLIKDKKINLNELSINNNMFVLIVKNKHIYDSTVSLDKSNNILKNYEYLINNYTEDAHEYDGYMEVNDYIVDYRKIKINNNEYEIYLGIYEFVLYEFLSEIYLFVYVLNFILFFILLILGYILIDKTIKPLKLILEDISKMRNKKDLALRLFVQNTNDEFESISKTLNEMLDHVEHSVKNIKQFSSDASHELRTPLTIIQGELELYKKGKLSKEEIHETLLNIDIEQKKLQNIIDDFLLLARLDKDVINPENSLLDKVVFDVIEINLMNIENKGLNLEFDIDEDLEVLFNEKYLFIVINNLLTNAVKYTQKGSIKIEAKNKNGHIYFSVKDTGIGISKEDIPRIFERFYRADEVRTNAEDGVGIGLSIVKKICDSFHFKIEVSSQINKGTTFTLYPQIQGE